MARKMAEWHPKHRPITKIMLPDGVKGDTAPLALGLWYDFHEVGCHLGNVGILPKPGPIHWQILRFGGEMSVKK